MQVFTNNSVATLAVAISNSDTAIVGDALGSATFASLPVDSRDTQLVTITDPSEPGEIEIISVLERVGTAFTVARGFSGTPARAWGVGASMSARVTAKTLQSFLQNSATGARSIGIGGDAAGLDSVAIYVDSRAVSNSWVIGGQPVLQADQTHRFTSISPLASVEAVVGSFSVDLGVPPAWAASTEYRQGDVITLAGGGTNQYRVSMASDLSDVMSGTAQPVADGDEIDLDPDSYSGGILVRADLADGFVLCPDQNNVHLYLTEVGFICDEYGAVSTPPTVSVGTANAGSVVSATAIANAESLTGVAGAGGRHKFATVPLAAVRGLSFKLVSAAAGGTFRGRFYFKGMFVEMLP